VVTRATPARSPRAPRVAAALSGYVLHRYDWSESSLILDVFTREQGRLAVAAKGVKRPFSQFRSVLLPFQRIQLTLMRGSAAPGESASEVQTLRSAEWAGGVPMAGGSALFSGFYLNELLMKLLARYDPHEALFDAYAATLPELGAGDDAQVQSALRAFELVLLQQTGLLPDLSLVTLTQQPVQPGGSYRLLPESGIAVGDAAEGGLGGTLLLGLQAALEHGSLAALQHACGGALSELKRALRAMVQHQLGASTLRTRTVMAGLQAVQALPAVPR
jgi:DNA repair protein RecO (recombination protein O)